MSRFKVVYIAVAIALLAGCSADASPTAASSVVAESEDRASDSATGITISQRIDIDHTKFEGRVLVEVVKPVSIEIRRLDVVDIEYEVQQAEVVEVHSEREITGVAPGELIRFYTGRPDFGNLLDGVDEGQSIYLLVREAHPADSLRSQELYGSDLQVAYAFTADGQRIQPVPRNAWIDVDIVDAIATATWTAESRGYLKPESSIAVQAGRLLDAYNAPSTGLRDELVAVEREGLSAEEEVVDRTDQLIADERYSNLEVAGNQSGSGSYIVSLTTASGADTGFLLDNESSFISTTVPVALGEQISIRIWTDEEQAFVSPPNYAGTAALQADQSGRTHGLVLTVGGETTLVTEVLSLSDFEALSQRSRPAYEPIPITPEPAD
jgi:hypothetical protein